MKSRNNISSWISWLVVLAFMGINFNSYCQEKDAGKLVNVIFRYDDYSANSVTDAEIKIIETFRDHGMPISIGIIPFKVAGDPEDPSEQDLLTLDSVKGEILKNHRNIISMSS